MFFLNNVRKQIGFGKSPKPISRSGKAQSKNADQENLKNADREKPDP